MKYCELPYGKRKSANQVKWVKSLKDTKHQTNSR